MAFNEIEYKARETTNLPLIGIAATLESRQLEPSREIEKVRVIAGSSYRG